MSNKVPLTLEQAKKLELKPTDSDVKPEGGIEFDARKDGDICYMGPCENGLRKIWYWIDGKCTLGYFMPC